MIVFLAGVHGVGKDFVGTPVAARLGFTRASASDLIRQERGKVTWDHTKKVDDLDANQLALIEAVSRLRVTAPDILLDGHFALRDPQDTIQRVPSIVFERLKLAGIVILADEPHTILARLAARDNYLATVDEIAELARAEMAHAYVVANALHVPIDVIEAPTELLLEQCITRFRATGMSK